MQITLNNNLEILGADKLTVNDLLQLKKYSFKMLIIKINGKLVPKNEYEGTWIQEGDDVTILHLISGG